MRNEMYEPGNSNFISLMLNCKQQEMIQSNAVLFTNNYEEALSSTTITSNIKTKSTQRLSHHG